MSETQGFFYFIGTLLVMMAMTSFILNKTLEWHLENNLIILTPNQKRTLKWAISSTVTILTGYFSLLYFLLLR